MYFNKGEESEEGEEGEGRGHQLRSSILRSDVGNLFPHGMPINLFEIQQTFKSQSRHIDMDSSSHVSQN